MYLHQAIARAIAEDGNPTMFGLIGDSNLFMVDHFVRELDGTYVGAVHEASAVMMASGFANRTGRLGIATVTHGPGLTNAMTALIENVRSRTPLLVITGDTRPSLPNHLQGADQEAIVAAAGAGIEVVGEPTAALDALRRSILRALEEQRPIVLVVPTEFSWAEVAYNPVSPVSKRAPKVPVRDEDLESATALLIAASRPLILVGRGAADPATVESVHRLSARIGAPITTTLRAKDQVTLPSTSLGIFGTLSTPTTSSAISSCDTVLALGASLSPLTTAWGSLTDGKVVVHCDSDPSALGRYASVSLGVVGDAKDFADGVLALLIEADARRSSFADRFAPTEAPGHDPSLDFDESRLILSDALATVDAAFGTRKNVVFDGGRFVSHAFEAMHAGERRSLVFTTAFGAIGLGMGAAIGTAVADPARPTLLVTGDGGYMMGGLAELNTAVRNGIALTVVLCNDSAYGAEHIQFADRGLDPDLSTFDWPNFVDVATAIGCRAFEASTPSELSEVLHEVKELSTSVVVIELKLDPSSVGSVAH